MFFFACCVRTVKLTSGFSKEASCTLGARKINVSSTQLARCSLGPKAVLKEEVAEKDESGDEASATETHECSGELVLDGSNT